MKIINKKYLIRNQQLRYAVTECNVLKQAKHPFIITLHYAFQTPEHLYMILDYCPGGDLSFHIARNLFEEDEAKFFIAELILAIEHLHNMDIIYRDLKPENIMITENVKEIFIMEILFENFKMFYMKTGIYETDRFWNC